MFNTFAFFCNYLRAIFCDVCEALISIVQGFRYRRKSDDASTCRAAHLPIIIGKRAVRVLRRAISLINCPLVLRLLIRGGNRRNGWILHYIETARTGPQLQTFKKLAENFLFFINYLFIILLSVTAATQVIFLSFRPLKMLPLTIKYTCIGDFCSSVECVRSAISTLLTKLI